MIDKVYSNDKNMVNEIINHYRFWRLQCKPKTIIFFYFLVSSYLLQSSVHELNKYIQLYSMTEWIIVILSQQITTFLAYHADRVIKKHSDRIKVFKYLINWQLYQ